MASYNFLFSSFNSSTNLLFVQKSFLVLFINLNASSISLVLLSISSYISLISLSNLCFSAVNLSFDSFASNEFSPICSN
jgi:hypothetical protein